MRHGACNLHLRAWKCAATFLLSLGYAPVTVPTNSSSPAGRARSILLVEEYGALAVAIASALKKFAPAHHTHVVSNLAAAEPLVARLRPELLIVDIDPPQPGTIDCFARMKFAIPAARVLVIAAGTSLNVLAARERPIAFEFVEKPFDIGDLGHAVEILLADTRGSAPTLGAFGLSDALPLLCGSSATMVLLVEAAGNRHGKIHLATGQIIHAVAGGRAGADALEEMLSWPTPSLAEADFQPEAARTIMRGWQPLLQAAFSRPKSRSCPRGEGEKQAARSGSAGHREKVVVIDDTELLLIFVEDVLTTAEPELEFVTASSGIEGLNQVASNKPVAVLLDYSLPDLTGDEVCRRLLEEESTAGIPVIMMSGHVPEMVATAARYGNVVATIAKPFLSSALVQLVRTTLARTKNTPEASAATSSRTVPERLSDVADPSGPQESALGRRERNGRGENPDLPPRSKRPRRSAPMPIVHSAVAQPLPTPTVVALLQNEMPEAEIQQIGATASSRETFDPDTISASADPVAFPGVARNGVILCLPLEVVAIQLSRSLQMAAIRARPRSATVSLHVQPHSSAGVALSDANFELAHVDLDSRGQIETLRLVPTERSITTPPQQWRFGVDDMAILPGTGGKSMELTSAASSPMTAQLFAFFEITGVELSPAFGLAAVLLRSCDTGFRVTLQADAPATAATFKTAQVLLDREARIAELLLDEMA